MGEDKKVAVAYLPQSTAAMVMRKTLLDLAPYAYHPINPVKHPENLYGVGCEDARLCLTVHDQVLLNVRQSKLYDVARHVKAVMTRPWPELGGLSIGCEISYGRNWAEASSVNPDGMRVLEV